MLSELMTEEELEVYDSFGCSYRERNNRKGFIGELAADKSVVELRVEYTTNSKNSVSDYCNSEGGGPDLKIGKDIYIEVKNWGPYWLTPEEYKRKIKSRFKNSNGLKLVIMGCARFSEKLKFQLLRDNIFLIVLGYRITLSNFGEAVIDIKSKLESYLRQERPALFLPLYIDPLFSLIISMFSVILEKISSESLTINEYSGYESGPPPKMNIIRKSRPLGLIKSIFHRLRYQEYSDIKYKTRGKRIKIYVLISKFFNKSKNRS